jgi:enoyl-CoA hydratase/carnithine racemase
MQFEEILYEVDDHVLTITLNRPERLNAFTGTMGRELIEALDAADADDDVRAVIVTGAGRGFCAGADLERGGSTFDWSDRHAAGEDVPRDGGGQISLRLFDCKKPVIAAINGPAVGVGITMTLPMDVRMAAEGAKIGFVFARRGIVPEACSSWFLPRIVGISQAMEWVATGPSDAVAHARRGPPDGGAPGRLARDVRARPLRRRARGRHLVPGEASGGVHRSRERRAARDHAVVRRTGVQLGVLGSQLSVLGTGN